jgi:hypothetical protein
VEIEEETEVGGITSQNLERIQNLKIFLMIFEGNRGISNSSLLFPPFSHLVQEKLRLNPQQSAADLRLLLFRFFSFLFDLFDLFDVTFSCFLGA